MVAGAVGASERRSIEACGADGACVPIVLVLAGCGGGAHAPPRAPMRRRLAGRPDLRPRADAQRPDRHRQRLAGSRERPAAAGRGRPLRARRAGRGARVRRRGPRARGARAPRRGRAARVRRARPPACRAVTAAATASRWTCGRWHSSGGRAARTQPLKAPAAHAVASAIPADALSPLPLPRSDAFAVLLAIVSGAHGNIERIDAAPARHAPCGLAARTIAAHVWITTPRPVVGVLRRTVYRVALRSAAGGPGASRADGAAQGLLPAFRCIVRAPLAVHRARHAAARRAGPRARSPGSAAGTRSRSGWCARPTCSPRCPAAASAARRRSAAPSCATRSRR